MIAIQKRTILKYLPIANILFWITNMISYISTYQVVFQGKPYYVRSYLAKTVTTNLWSSEFIVIVWLLMRLALYDACFGNYKHYNWACFRPALSPSIPVWLVMGPHPSQYSAAFWPPMVSLDVISKKINRTVFNFCFLYTRLSFLAKQKQDWQIDYYCNKI